MPPAPEYVKPGPAQVLEIVVRFAVRRVYGSLFGLPFGIRYSPGPGVPWSSVGVTTCVTIFYNKI